MYYFPTGPIGQLFHRYEGTLVTRRVGLVGLGVGSLAAYGKAGQELTFFEIDPTVERIARDPVYFHYLEDCQARWRVVLGDARLSLGREPDAAFGLIVLDAFNSDSVPTHLLTREAMRIYLAKLAEGGLIALHVSNNYLDLAPAISALARDAGLVGIDKNEATVPRNELEQGRMPSHWIALARRQADLALLSGQPGWRPLRDSANKAVWTDDYSDLISLIWWR
jgi:spermidine synthase